MASLYSWLALAATLCTARSIERGISGGSQYDQIRFMDCDNSGQVVGYYGRPPQGNDPPQTIFASWGHGSTFSVMNWDALCGQQTWTVGQNTMQCGLSNFAANEAWKTYIGNITYDGEGFNCFVDDGHAVHKDPRFGQCRSSIYCVHDYASVVRIAASSNTVFVGEHTEGENLARPPNTDAKATVANILGKITSRINAGGQNCDAAPVDIGSGCQMLLSECSSTDATTMSDMVQLLLSVYAGHDGLFAVNDSDDTIRPNRGGSIRGYTRGVTMPSTYTLNVYNTAPPHGDGSLNLEQVSSTRGSLKATIVCPINGKDSKFCTALTALTKFGGAIPGAGPLMSFAGGVVLLGCS